MTTFNSISEIVNTVANFNKEPFILVPSYTGEYIPNWDIITEDGPMLRKVTTSLHCQGMISWAYRITLNKRAS